MKNKDVVILCGEYPENHVAPDIGNDPNFVFSNDPNFPQVRLFDIDGNTVFVNSFIECEHYVNGTWNFYPGKDEINFITNMNIVLFSFLFVFVFTKIFLKRKVN
ncbi:hypothetical protein OA408_00490 [Acidimicrobiaceae bacterium]|nr:hypothetical protein [Acidimicrobiaceae bacterium]